MDMFEKIRTFLSAGRHYDRGCSLEKSKRYDEAEKEFREVIRIDPEHEILVHNRLGLVLVQLKKYDEAEKEFRKAIRINSNVAEFYANLGYILYKDLNRPEEAKNEFKTAVRLFRKQGNHKMADKIEWNFLKK